MSLHVDIDRIAEDNRKRNVRLNSNLSKSYCHTITSDIPSLLKCLIGHQKDGFPSELARKVEQGGASDLSAGELAQVWTHTWGSWGYQVAGTYLLWDLQHRQDHPSEIKAQHHREDQSPHQTWKLSSWEARTCQDQEVQTSKHWWDGDFRIRSEKGLAADDYSSEGFGEPQLLCSRKHEPRLVSSRTSHLWQRLKLGGRHRDGVWGWLWRREEWQRQVFEFWERSKR